MTELYGASALLVAALLVAISLLITLRIKSRHYPPSPNPRFIVGNAFDIPSKKPWLKYLRWSKELNSDVIHLSAMNIHIVVLHKLKDAVTLMEKRSAYYSDRPVMPILEISGMDIITATLPYGNTWREQRRIFHECLKKDAIPPYHDIQLEKVRLFLGQLLHDPNGFREHCKWLSVSISMAMTFGYNVLPGQLDDPLVEVAESVVHAASELLQPGRTLLNVFPFLKYVPLWMPGTSTQRFAARVKAMTVKYRNEPFEYAKGNMVPGMTKDKGCISTDLLQRRAKKGGSYDEEEILKDVIANIYLAGVETITCAKAIFFIAMSLHPAAQKKAQEEIDRVVGPYRLVTFEDRISLPYVEALYREVLRWRPVAPLGFPHSTIRDEVYQGYHIPKGCFVIANIWAMTRDEATYPDPEAFHPERFFLPNGSLNDDGMGYVFGFGRRICPGRYMADSVLWLMMASVLSTFDIAKAKDGNGAEIDIDLDAFSDTVVSQPPSFQCSILPRSEQVAEWIRAL